MERKGLIDFLFKYLVSFSLKKLIVTSFLMHYNKISMFLQAKFNKPLLIAKCDEANLLIKQHENLLYSRLKMFVHLRQDLERVSFCLNFLIVFITYFY